MTPVTPVRPFTRLVLVVGFGLTAGTGLGLWLVPDRTEDYWAWTIRAPLSAALLGAGYVGAAIGLALGVRERMWQRARVIVVAAATLTSLTLLATLRHLDAFALDADDPLPRAVAWTWLAVYVALPLLAVAAFTLQERAGGRREYGIERPLLRSTRLVLLAFGIVLAPIGIGLLLEWSALAERWPWPLPELPAAMVGIWLLTYAAAFLWLGLRERDWRRARIGVPIAIAFAGLQLGAAARFSGDLEGGGSTWLYVGLLVSALVAFLVVAWREEAAGWSS